MRSGITHRRLEGFTVWDLLIVVTTLLLFAAWLLVPMKHSQVKASRINCVSNLKQVGLGFRMWANDHAEQFPWMVSTNEGGTREFVDQGGVLFHFRAISNEVTTPKVLACATDQSRTRATSFMPVANRSSEIYLNNAAKQISYFVGLDADAIRPQSILSGDRNVTGATPSKEGILTFSNNTQLSFTKELHNGFGNIGLADGSAAQVTTAALNKQMQAALLSTNRASVRLALPQ